MLLRFALIPDLSSIPWAFLPFKSPSTMILSIAKRCAKLATLLVGVIM
jgi:hypothetical protein